MRQVYRKKGLPQLILEIVDYLITPIAIIWYAWTYNISYRSSYSIHTNGERPILIDLLTATTPSDTFYDIGANQGLYSEKVAQIVGPENVVAIDPGKGLEKLNDRGPGEIHTLNKAICNDHDSKFSSDGEKIIHGDVMNDSTDGKQLETISAEELLNTYTAPSIVKIDVNGWDLPVVHALEPVLDHDDCRLCYIEIEPPNNENLHRHPRLLDLAPDELNEYFNDHWSFDELLITFTRLGFDIDYIMDDGGDLFIKASKGMRYRSGSTQPVEGFEPSA